jgi:hypothetical protein
MVSPQPTHDPLSHNHDRGHMMIASNGVVDALLTSHLSSRGGNELDIFIEKGGAPLALTISSLPARARVAPGAVQVLDFECAPSAERPAAEPSGRCSHFVARATWMTPGDRLEVATTLPLLSGEIVYTWRRFDPRRYAHYVD